MTPAKVKKAIDPIRNTVAVNGSARATLYSKIDTLGSPTGYMMLPTLKAGISVNANQYHHYAVSNGSYLWMLFNSTRQLYLARYQLPLSSSRTATETLLVDNTGLTTSYTTRKFLCETTRPVMGSKAATSLGFQIGAQVSGDHYWPAIIDFERQKMWTNGNYIDGVSYYYYISTDNYIGYCYGNNNDGYFRTWISAIDKNSVSTPESEVNWVTAYTGNSTDHYFKRCIGGVGDTLWFATAVDGDNTVTICFSKLVFSGSGSSTTTNATKNVATMVCPKNIAIDDPKKPYQEIRLMCYDSRYSYVLANGYTVPIIFDMVNGSITNESYVKSSTVSTAIANVDTSPFGTETYYYGTHNGTSYFKANATTFSYVLKGGSGSAITVRSNYSIPVRGYCKIAYSSTFTNAYLCQSGVNLLSDLDGKIIKPYKDTLQGTYYPTSEPSSKSTETGATSGLIDTYVYILPGGTQSASAIFRVTQNDSAKLPGLYAIGTKLRYAVESNL